MAEQATLGRQGGERDAGQDHEGAHAAAAKPDDRAKSAGADQGHAETEHDAANDRTGDRQRFGQVETARKIDPAEKLHHLSQCQRHGRRQNP